MAIDAYLGLPGSGKSYGVVEYCIIPSLKEGRHVVTNIPLEVSLLTSVFGGEITTLPDDWYEAPEFSNSVPNGCVLILDEVWRKYPAGQKVNQVPVHDMALLKEHRHRVDSYGKSMRVILVTQAADDLSSWLRKLVAHTYRMEKLDALGSSKRFRVDIFKGCPTGENPPKRLLIRQSTGTYKPEIYQYYRSATQSESFSAGDETVADKRASIWQSKFLIFCLLFGVLGPVAGVYGVYDYFASAQEKAEKEAHADKAKLEVKKSERLVNPPPPGMDFGQGVAVQVPAADVATGETKPLSDPLSTFWRVAGYLDVAKGQDNSEGQLKKQVLLSGVGTARRIVPFSDCEYLDNGIDVQCIVDGQRVTPWTGQQNVMGILPPQVAKLGTETVARGERSEQSATASAPAVQTQQPRSPVVVADNSRLPRTLMKE